MAKQGQDAAPSQTAGQTLDGLAKAARGAGAKGLPPVHLWNPDFCGDLDMRIARDGTWFYLGTPIGRLPLVRLFSTILKREGDDRRISFRTNVDDWVDVDADHGLRFETGDPNGGLTPYVHVRANLWAKVTRALYYDLVDMGEERMVDGEEMFGLMSAGTFFPIGTAEQVRTAS